MAPERKSRMRNEPSNFYYTRRLLLAVFFFAAFVVVLWLAPKQTPRLTSAYAAVSHAESSPPPQPESMDFAWSQLTSFIFRQRPNLTTIPQGKIDSDWNQDWLDKASLNINGNGSSDCPQSAAIFPAPNPFSAIASKQLRIPVQLLKAIPDQPGKDQPNCNGIVLAVIYNQTASNCIRGQGKGCSTDLSLQPNLEQLVSSAASNPIQFPIGTVVVKAMWQSIGNGVISVWDPTNPYFQTRDSSGYLSPSNWQTKISLDTTPSGVCSSSDYPIPSVASASTKPTGRPQVPLACFITSTDNGYVLMGFNVAHKTVDGWHWVTFAWTNSPSQPSNGFVSSGRPSYLTPWAHYLVNFTDAAVDPRGTKICFNPYLEGQPMWGPQSNCTRCHQFATYFTKKYIHDSGDGFAPVIRGTGPKFGNNPTPPSKCAVSSFQEPGLPTDRLWSIVTHFE